MTIRTLVAIQEAYGDARFESILEGRIGSKVAALALGVAALGGAHGANPQNTGPRKDSLEYAVKRITKPSKPYTRAQARQDVMKDERARAKKFPSLSQSIGARPSTYTRAQARQDVMKDERARAKRLPSLSQAIGARPLTATERAGNRRQARREVMSQLHKERQQRQNKFPSLTQAVQRNRR